MNKNEFIPVNTPLLNGNEAKYLNECISTGWISSEGPFVKRFENAMAHNCERKFASAVSSGTAALDLAFRSLQLKQGDEVILPSFTIISCAAAIIRAGLRPVFVDVDSKTWNTDLNCIKKAFTPKTKALLLPHIYGLPIDLDPILQFASDNNLLVVEDAAQMHGQSYKNRPCGSFGDISVFSFYANKLITTGEGGMVLTDNPDIHQRVESLKNQAFSSERRFFHHEIGFNFRMTNLQAAVGVAQFENLSHFTKLKRKMGERFRSNLSGIKGIDIPIHQTDYATNIYWAYGIVLHQGLQDKIDQITKDLLELNIGTRPFFWPLHQQPALQELGLTNTCWPMNNTEYIARSGFYLPSSPALTVEQIDYISQSLIDTLSHYR